jgi:tetratricopeptide (TPR) repeat protein
VLYEMVTGHLPFKAATPLATALMRLQVPPPPPRTWVPELEPRWDSVLLRCLAKKPRDRFTTASEVIAALRGPRLVPVPTQPSELQHGPALAPSSPARQGIAVFPPRNLRPGPETAWISTALAEVLSAELAASGQVRLLSGEEVARMRKELSLPEEESFAGDTLRRIRIHSKVDLVLTGTYLVLSQAGTSTVRLDLRLQDAASGEAVAHLTDTGPEQDLLTLLAHAGGALRKHLGLAPLTSEQAREIRTTMPSRAETARLYAEGLAALRNSDAATAMERLEQVVAKEPRFALAHSALAAACKVLFLAAQAKDSARRAFELSEDLPQEERLLVQARHHEALADWGPAIEAYRALVALSPDSVDYGTALVSAQLSAGQPREAQNTIAALRKLPPPLCQDARIDLSESSAAANVSDFEASCRHADAAMETARGAGQRLMVATALIAKAFAVRNLGNPAGAVALMQESEQLFLMGGDPGGAIRSMLARAIALTDLTLLREARSVYENVLRMVQGYRGSLIEGEVLGNAGWLAAHIGSLTEALKLTRESIWLFQGLEMPTELAHFSVQLGMVRRYQGALDEAQRLLEDALHAAQAIGDDFTEAWAHHELGNLFLDRDDLVHARSRLKRAMELRQARGLQAFVVETGLSLARLAIKKGRLEEALAIAEQARDFYEEQQNRDKEGLACALLGRALLVGGEFSRARETLAHAQALASQSDDVFIMAEAALTGAWAAARFGTPSEREEAGARLWEFITRTREGGLKGLELQAQLGLAELEQASSSEPARIDLLALEQEATQLGYFAIARRVQTVARR